MQGTLRTPQENVIQQHDAEDTTKVGNHSCYNSLAPIQVIAKIERAADEIPKY